MSKRRPHNKKRAAFVRSVVKYRYQGMRIRENLDALEKQIRSERLAQLAQIATSGPDSLLICGAGMIVSRSGNVRRMAWI